MKLDREPTGMEIEVTVEMDTLNPTHAYLLDCIDNDKLIRIELVFGHNEAPISSFAEASIRKWGRPIHDGPTYLTVNLTLVELEAPPVPEWRDMESESMDEVKKELIEEFKNDPKLRKEFFDEFGIDVADLEK